MTREDVIRIALEVGFDDGEIETCQLMFERFAALVASSEREACAKIADEWAVGWPHPSTVIAERIRARGQA